MTKMIFKDNVFHKELSNDSTLSTTYYVNVLCGLASGDVEIYGFGLPGAVNPEFNFYFQGWEDKLTSGTEEEKLLAMSLSANGGWGHANSTCFIPNGSTDFLENE